MSHLISKGQVSLANSSAVPLAAGASFTGPGEEHFHWSSSAVSFYAEPSSATGTLFFEFSTDNVNWDQTVALPVSDPTEFEPHTVTPIARYFRVRYVNDGVPQTAMRLQVIHHTERSSGQMGQMAQSLSDLTDVENVRATLVGRNPVGGYSNVPITPDGALSVGFRDGVNLDAFSRLRSSTPFLLFDSKIMRGRKEELLWQEELTAGGTSVVSDNRSSVTLEVANAGDKVVRRTRSRIIYQPGRSMAHWMTGVTPVLDANVRWRVGFFDENDGIFLEGQGASIRWVIRSSTSGVPVEEEAFQADWNRDKFDGSGGSDNPCGINLDFDRKNFLLWFDMQWLSVGRVRCGFDYGGSALVAHEFNHANLTDAAYMKNPNLTLRYEIEALGPLGAPRRLESLCAASASEGGHNPVGISTPVSRGRSGVSVSGTYQEVISVRLQANVLDKMSMLVKRVNLMCSTGGNIHWMLVLNPTGLGAGAWVAAPGDSSLEYNITRGAGWSPGNEDHILDEGYFSNNSDSGFSRDVSRIRPGVKADGSADVVSLLAANASGGANETVFGDILIHEIF